MSRCSWKQSRHFCQDSVSNDSLNEEDKAELTLDWGQPFTKALATVAYETESRLLVNAILIKPAVKIHQQRHNSYIVHVLLTNSLTKSIAIVHCMYQ